MSPLRLAQLEQAMSLIHDALHKGDVEAAHELAHRALGIDGNEIDLKGPRFYRDFEQSFLTAVRKHNVPAAFLILDYDDPSNPRKARVLTGGNAGTNAILEEIIKAGMHAVSEA